MEMFPWSYYILYNIYMKEKITFRELAKKSNVGVGTLSRYFNGGYVSNEKKEVIKQNIEKYSFVRNGSAAKIKKGGGTIILRTFMRSLTQDNLVSGIIFVLKNDVIVKYADKTEESIMKEIKWAVEQRPKRLIIFSPINPTDKLQDILKWSSQYTDVVTFNYKNEETDNVEISYDNAFKELSIKHKDIHFVYDDESDRSTYKDRIEQIKKYFKNVTISKEIEYNKINIFQTERLRRDLIVKNIKNINKIRTISISYEEPIFWNKNQDEWIFADSFLVGITIAKTFKQLNKSNKTIEAKLAQK